MSIRATNFVRRLRGLSPDEKAVAFVLADHDNHKGGGCTASMATVAEEAGFADRETASRITSRLAQAKIIYSPSPSKGRKPTTWYFNFDFTFGLVNCDSPITVAPLRTVTRQSQSTVTQPNTNRDSAPVENQPTVIQNPSNRDSPVTGRVVRENIRKGKAEAREALHAKFTAAATAIDEAFALLDGTGSPYGSLEFQLEWLATVESSSQHEGDVRTEELSHRFAFLPDSMERCIQTCSRKLISVPPPFYDDKRRAENNRDIHYRRSKRAE